MTLKDESGDRRSVELADLKREVERESPLGPRPKKRGTNTDHERESDGTT